MDIEFDPVKDAINIEQHGLSLTDFSKLDFEKGLFAEDDRRSYGECRMRVLAPLDGRLCIAVFTMRGNRFRVISLRKANQRERRTYANDKTEVTRH